MKLVTAIILLTVWTTGCAQLNSVRDKSSDKIAQGITEYCANTDQDYRNGLREDVNAKAAPHSIAITC